MVRGKDVVLGSLSVFAGVLIGDWYYSHRIEDTQTEAKKRGEKVSEYEKKINCLLQMSDKLVKENKNLTRRVDFLTRHDKEQEDDYENLSQKYRKSKGEVAVLQKKMREMESQLKASKEAVIRTNSMLQERTAEYAQEKAKNASLQNNLSREKGKKDFHIYQKDKEGNLIGTYQSFKEAKEKTGISAGLIFNVLAGTKKTAGGFIWECDAIDSESGML